MKSRSTSCFIGWVKAGLLMPLLVTSLVNVGLAKPPKPPVSGTPSSVPGTVRGCPKEPLVALIPQQKQPKQLALTAASSPIFLVYLPPLPPTVQFAKFKVFDRQNNLLLTSNVRLPGRSGIQRLRLSSTVLALQPNQIYRWQFTVICQESDRAQDVTTEAYIRRVDLDDNARTQLEAATAAEDKLSFYATRGLWHDLMALMADLRLQYPDDVTLRDGWRAYLKSAGLESLAQQVLLPLIELHSG